MFKNTLHPTESQNLKRLDYAVIVFLALMLLGVFFSGDPPPSPAFTQFNLARLNKAEEKDGMQVVVLGTSLLSCALQSDATLSQTLSEQIDEKVNFTKIVSLDGTSADYEGLLSKVLEMKPKLLFLQSSYICKSHSRYAKMRLKRAYLISRVLGDVKGWSYDPEHQKKAQEYKAPITERNNITDVTIKYSKAFYYKRYVSYKPNTKDLVMFDEFLKKCAQEGITVRYLYVPMTKIGSEASGEDEVDLSKSDVLYPDAKFEEADFADYFHMDESGREIYSSWFISEVSRMLGGANSGA